MLTTPCEGVPTISRFYGIEIRMYFRDHLPPHFHAKAAGGRAKVRIEDAEVISSTLDRRRLRYVLAWAELHRDELMDNWHRARSRGTLEPIEPLR